MTYPTSTLLTTRNLTYTYIHIAPSSPSPTSKYILFLHGFPSSSHDWHFQIEHFKNLGYGIIVPDLLGYGGTSKPLDYKVYNGKGMAGDVKEILEKEGVETLVGVAHDWGCYLLSRLANYYPSLFTQLVFIDIGYAVPGRGLSTQTIQFVNQMVKSKAGYEVFGYFLFFDEEGAGALMDENGDSVQSLFHTRDDAVGKEYMGATGGFKKWLEAKKTLDFPSYLTEEDIELNRKSFSKENGGYSAAINWYRAQLHDVNAEDDKTIPQEAAKLKQPTMLIVGNNFITATSDFPTQMEGSCEDLTVEKLDAGHWIMMEKAKEVNELLEKFI